MQKIICKIQEMAKKAIQLNAIVVDPENIISILVNGRQYGRELRFRRKS